MTFEIVVTEQVTLSIPFLLNRKKDPHTVASTY